jgi:hypothetical protein
MPGDDDASCGEVKAPIALLFTAVTDENATTGLRLKLVGSGGGEVGKAQAAKGS